MGREVEPAHRHLAMVRARQLFVIALLIRLAFPLCLAGRLEYS